MVQAQVQSTAKGAIIFDAALGIAPTPAWFDRAHWQQVGGSAAGRGGVVFIETPVGACALRHYHRGGLVARVSADAYLWTGAARTRAFREFRLLAELQQRGLPVSPPVAACYLRDGFTYRADLLTRRVDGETLALLLGQDRLDAALAERVGRTIADFHSAGVWHADLNAHNILVGPDAVVTLIDFDRGRLLKPRFAWQQSNLQRLQRSLHKLGARRQPAFDARFWHPLLAGYHDGMSRRVRSLPGGAA